MPPYWQSLDFWIYSLPLCCQILTVVGMTLVRAPLVRAWFLDRSLFLALLVITSSGHDGSDISMQFASLIVATYTLVIKQLVILPQVSMLFPTEANSTSPHLGRYSLCCPLSLSTNIHFLLGTRFPCFHWALLGGVNLSAKGVRLMMTLSGINGWHNTKVLQAFSVVQHQLPIGNPLS